jgi:hypothetical protein
MEHAVFFNPSVARGRREHHIPPQAIVSGFVPPVFKFTVYTRKPDTKGLGRGIRNG